MMNMTVKMVYHQAHMFEYRGTIDMQILSMTLFSELLNLRRKL